MSRIRIGEAEKTADTRWMTDARCLDYPDLPWIEDLGHASKQVRAEMREVCAACPVRASCAAYAVEVGINAGWWAGRSMHRNAAGRLVDEESGSDAA